MIIANNNVPLELGDMVLIVSSSWHGEVGTAARVTHVPERQEEYIGVLRQLFNDNGTSGGWAGGGLRPSDVMVVAKNPYPRPQNIINPPSMKTVLRIVSDEVEDEAAFRRLSSRIVEAYAGLVTKEPTDETP